MKKYWIRYRFLNEIKNLVNFENQKILDVGCAGPSSVLHLLEGERYGVDPLIDDLQKVYELDKEIHWQKAYGENLPFEDEFFDIVISSNAIDHVANLQETLKEINRVLKPKGKFILTADIFKKNFKRDERHPYTFIEEDVLNLLKDYKILFKEISKVNACFFKFLKGEDVEKINDNEKDSYFLKDGGIKRSDVALGEIVIVAEKQ